MQTRNILSRSELVRGIRLDPVCSAQSSLTESLIAWINRPAGNVYALQHRNHALMLVRLTLTSSGAVPVLRWNEFYWNFSIEMDDQPEGSQTLHVERHVLGAILRVQVAATLRGTACNNATRSGSFYEIDLRTHRP
jgi:hypothetical protein